MSDRTLGYGAMLFLMLFVFAPAVYFTSKALSPGHKRTVVFDSIYTGSFVRIQDPVRLKGFEAGQIKSIKWDSGKTLVFIETKEPLAIHEGYHIIAEAKGLMGDRYLEIEPGNTALPLISEKTPLRGFFPMGPTEAIAYMEKLKASVDSLVIISGIYRNGTLDKPSFMVRFNTVIKSIDSAENSLLAIFREADRLIGTKGDSLFHAIEKADELAGEITEKAPRAAASIESIIIKTEKLLVAADTLVAATDRLIQKANGPEVQEIRASYVKLKEQMLVIRSFLIEVNKKGIVLPIKIL